MTINGEPGHAPKRSQLAAYLLLGIAFAWGLFHTAHLLYIHSGMAGNTTPTHDLFSYYSIWFVLGHRDCADIALRESLYLPHTWFAFTPLFILGWPAARTLMWLINFAAVFYTWWRLSELASLQGVRRWLLLAFFLGWTGTGNVIGLGNLALVCLAAVVAAFPFASSKNGVFLMFAAMKQSLVFPLYFYLLLKRSKVLIVPFVTFAVCGLAVLWWARLSFAEGLQLPKYWAESASKWTSIDITCLRRVLALFISNKLAVTVVMWVIWFALFGITARWIKDPLTQMAALLLLTLLPTYHYQYDMVVAVPALAVFLKRCHLVWPTLMTFSLSWGVFWRLATLMPAGPLRSLCEGLNQVYYPLLILFFLGGLIWLELRREPPSNAGGLRPNAPIPDGSQAAGRP
jgi:hypothetical protein